MAEVQRPAQLVRFGIFEADLRSGELRKNGSKIRLQEQPFQILVMLLERRGDVVSREELCQRLWPADTFVEFERSLNTAINKLRQALGDSAANPRFIETLARRGYRFLAPVQPADDAMKTAQPAPKITAPQVPEELPHVHRGFTRLLFTLIQLMYLSFYVVCLAKLPVVENLSEEFLGGRGWILAVLVIISAVLGIPTRLYLLTAAGFDYRWLGRNFRRLFPFVLLIDELWALSPFFITHKVSIGLAFAATAALLYLPFSERTLIRMAYRE